MGLFTGKTLLITGGTGSFGNAVLNRFLDTDIGEIRIFSRDEKKQDDMRHLYQQKYPAQAGKLKFHIGDVRDPGSILDAMHGVNYVFHAAALKQVPSCEEDGSGTDEEYQVSYDIEVLIPCRGLLFLLEEFTYIIVWLEHRRSYSALHPCGHFSVQSCEQASDDGSQHEVCYY